MADHLDTPEKAKTHGGDSDQAKMQHLAQKVEAHYTRPLPDAQPMPYQPFPRPVMLGLWAGLLIGALFGLLAGALLHNFVISISALDALYSMGPFTFYAFWTITGIAAGILFIGVAAILSAPPPPYHELPPE